MSQTCAGLTNVTSPKEKKHREECTVEPWTGMLRGCYTWSILGFQTRLKIFTRIGTWHTSTFSQKFHCQHKATIACYDSFNGYSEAMGWIAPSWRKPHILKAFHVPRASTDIMLITPRQRWKTYQAVVKHIFGEPIWGYVCISLLSILVDFSRC